MEAFKSFIISFDRGSGVRGTVEFGKDATKIKFLNGNDYAPIYLGKIDEHAGSNGCFTVKNGKFELEIL